MNYRRFYENAVIIAPKARQRELLSLRKENPLCDFKLLTKEEAVSFEEYRYDCRAIAYLIEKGYGYNEAKETLNGLAKFQLGKTYGNATLDALYPLFEELIQKDFLYKDVIPEKTFEGRHVVISGYSDASMISKALGEIPNLDTTFDFIPKAPYPKLHYFDTLFGELHAVFTEIAKLLKANVPIEKIFLANIPEEASFLIEEFSKEYGFAVALPNKAPLFETRLGRDFLSSYEQKRNLKLALEELTEEYEESKDYEALYLALAPFELPSLSFERQKAIFIEILKSVNATALFPSPAVNVLEGYYAPEGSYVFFLDFSLSSAPKKTQFGARFKEEERLLLGYPSLLEKDAETKNELMALLSSPSLYYLSFHAHHIENEYHLSPLVEELGLEIAPESLFEKEYSELYKKLFGAYLFDREKKYGIKSPLTSFYYDSSISPYSNQMKMRLGYLEKSGRKTYSYTGITSYFQCPFRFYLGRVLKIKDEGASFSAMLGTLCHKVMEEAYSQEDFDFDSSFEKAEKLVQEDPEEGRPFDEKERFFVRMFQEDLKKVYEYIESEERSIQNRSYETEYTQSIPLDKETYLFGQIDKIISFGKEEDKLAIIDYKTYAKGFDERRFEYGLDLQLPTYSLITKLDPKFKDKQIAGLFISPILLDKKKGIDLNDPSSYGASLKLNGLFTSDKEALSEFANQEYVLGLGYKQDGSFTVNALKRAKSPKDFDDLAERAKQLILSADQKIRNSEFPIAPVRSSSLGVDGCEYCPYRSICYVHPNQYHYLSKDDETEVEEDG